MSDAQQTPNVRPALETLKRDQMALLTGEDDRDLPALRMGFESRRAAIEWYQAASVRTFGFIADEFAPINLCRDTTLLQALITSEKRERWVFTDEPLSFEAAFGHRRWIETQLLGPASNRAYNQLRKMAGEYIDDEDQQLAHYDPEEQDHVAMRPGFQQKDQQQRVALRELWVGFESEEALRDWIHYLDEPTNGAVDPDLARKIVVDDVAIRARTTPRTFTNVNTREDLADAATIVESALDDR